jgi:hypothetical protein
MVMVFALFGSGGVPNCGSVFSQIYAKRPYKDHLPSPLINKHITY